MIKLKDIVLQMKDGEFQLISTQFKETKADKFLMLLVHLRQNTLNDEEIAESLQIGTNAYYTLKSRLHSRIQAFLMSNILGAKADILQRVTNIPQLLYNTPKDTSIAVLTKLESDLLLYDMPWELTRVYNALKKLHIHSPKFYEYSQHYNKHVAYTIAIEKAEDLLSDFFKNLGNYHVSRDPAILDLLYLIKKEITNHYKLYKSHHLTLYFNFINISFALFVPMPEVTKDDEPIEDMLDSVEKIISSFEQDSSYQFLSRIYHFLAFEYYHYLKQYKKASPHFDEINRDISSFLLYNFCSIPSQFLYSKIERYIIFDQQDQLLAENKLLAKYNPDNNDLPNYIGYMKYMAISAFYSGKYLDSISYLNNVMNEVSFRNCSHAEIEIKLFLAFCYSLINNYETAHNIVKSASRKIREINTDNRYENALIFSKMLNLLIDSQGKNNDEKIKLLIKKFLALNKSDTKMLEYLTFNDKFMEQTLRVVKNNVNVN